MPPATAAAAGLLFVDALGDVARMARDTNEARFDALTAMLAERRIAFEVEPFTIEPRKSEPRTQGRNLVVTIAGRMPEIVIGAHYDAVRLGDGTLSQGAVDNAASAIILVRLAETLAKTRLRTQVRIVFFDMEELGLLGSAQYIQAHRDRPVRAMINLDVNAFGNAVIFGPRTVSSSAAFQSLRKVCVEIATACAELPRMPPSDDISFQKAGIPAVLISTMSEVEAHQLWLRMNAGKESGLQAAFVPQVLRIIHTTGDVSSLIDRDAMARAYRIALTLVATLDRR